MRAPAIAGVIAACMLAAAIAKAKPPPGFCDIKANKAECAWWEAQRQSNGDSCCGAPDSEGHVLAASDWYPTGKQAHPFMVLVRWQYLGAAHQQWLPVPAAVVVPVRDWPEPNHRLAAFAKVWYAAVWNEDGSPDIAHWRWYCFEPVEGS